jgi:thiosulfate sulfurtransferase
MPDSVSVPTLRELLERSEPPIVLDVRRAQAFADSPDIIPGAARRLPESVESWADELLAAEPDPSVEGSAPGRG